MISSSYYFLQPLRTVYNCSQPCTTVYNRLQPSTTVYKRLQSSALDMEHGVFRSRFMLGGCGGAVEVRLRQISQATRLDPRKADLTADLDAHRSYGQQTVANGCKRL